MRHRPSAPCEALGALRAAAGMLVAGPIVCASFGPGSGRCGALHRAAPHSKDLGQYPA